MNDSISRYIAMSGRLFKTATTLLLAITSLPAYGSITFTPLGFLSDSNFYSEARAVSNNGIVVGSSASGIRGRQAFRWTATGGLEGLGSLGGGTVRPMSYAYGISADGVVIVGEDRAGVGDQAFRWTETGGMVGLGDLPGNRLRSSAQGVSADGAVVVGRGLSDSGGEAFRWTEAGMVGLGLSGTAYDVSTDGSVIVGTTSGREAFRWTEAGLVGLGDLPGGLVHSDARDVSSDGSVVVGQSWSDAGTEAFRWTEAEGMVSLGGSGVAYGVSGDGKLIVGESNGAFLWDEANGMRSLQDLVEDAGWDLTGWTLQGATGISDNGRYIVGYGMNPDSNTEAWLIDLGTHAVPEPLSVVVWGGLTCFAAMVINRRRRV